MESLFSMEFLMSIDSVLCVVSGIVVGIAVWQFVRGWSLGLFLDLILGAIGGIVGGSVFNVLDFMNIGDYADPIVAGVVGSVLFIGVAGLLRR